MSHSEDLSVYLPNGLEVSPALLQELYPSWFSEEHEIENLFVASSRAWGLCSGDVSRLRQWCTLMIGAHMGTTREYWLAVCLVGTARKHSLEPVALIEIFENVTDSYRALFDKSARLPKHWKSRTVA